MKHLSKYMLLFLMLLSSVFGNAQCDIKNDLAEALFADSDLITYFSKNPNATKAYELLYELNKGNSTKIPELDFVANKMANQTPTQLKTIINTAGGYDSWKNLAKAGGKVGKYDLALVKKYFKHIQDVTGRAVPKNQIDKLKDALRVKEYKRLAKAEIDAHRASFNSNKNQIIKDWETNTGQQWPKYTESVYSKNGIELRKPGDLYDAHHIIETKYDGNNEWWNMHPARFPDQHQAGIHGEGSPSRELFK